MDKIKGVPSPIKDTEKPIRMYDVKVGDRFYYVDCHSRWIDVAEVRKIDIFNGCQRIFVRTFMTSRRTGKVIGKHTPQNPYHLWPEDKNIGVRGWLFRTPEEAYQYLVDYVKKDVEMKVEDLKNQARAYHIPLIPGSPIPQIQAPNEHQD